MSEGDSAGELLQRMRREEQCPLVNGVILGNGDVRMLSLNRVRSGDRYEVALRHIGDTNLSALEREGRLEWDEVTSLCESDFPEARVRVNAGEGGQGADGFVAVTELDDGRLRWLAFFDNSNPFVKVWLSGAKLHALTTLDDEWAFDLEQPGEVSVTAGHPHGLDLREGRRQT